jgi:hypothetical protein
MLVSSLQAKKTLKPIDVTLAGIVIKHTLSNYSDIVTTVNGAILRLLLNMEMRYNRGRL